MFVGPQIAPYTREQIRGLGQVPVSIRDCAEQQWPSLLRYVTWGYLPQINPAKSCFNISGGIYGTPVIGELCLSNTGDYKAPDPVISLNNYNAPSQPTATTPRRLIAFILFHSES